MCKFLNLKKILQIVNNIIPSKSFWIFDHARFVSFYNLFNILHKHLVWKFPLRALNPE